MRRATQAVKIEETASSAREMALNSEAAASKEREMAFRILLTQIRNARVGVWVEGG